MERYFQELPEKKTTSRASYIQIFAIFLPKFSVRPIWFSPFNFQNFLFNGRISEILQF